VSRDRDPLPGARNSHTGGQADEDVRHRYQADQPRCPGVTKGGLPCGAKPTHDGACPQHSSRYTPADRSEWGRRGSLIGQQRRAEQKLQKLASSVPDVPPDFRTSEAMTRYLENCARKIEQRQMAPSQVRAIAALAKLVVEIQSLQAERDVIALELQAAERDRGGRR